MLVIPTTQVSTVPFLFKKIALMLVSQTPRVSTVPFLFKTIASKLKCYTMFCTESLVLVTERRLMVPVFGLKRVLSKAYIGLSWPVALRCHCCLVDHG